MARTWDGPSGGSLDGLIEDFIRSQVTGRGLDDRTEKAYRLDLEHFSRWLAGDGGTEGTAVEGSLEEHGLAEKSLKERGLEKRKRQKEALGEAVLGKAILEKTTSGKGALQKTAPKGADLEQEILRYLRYLATERKLRTSTIYRKGRVFRYFLAYLGQTGQVGETTAEGSHVLDGRSSFGSSDRSPYGALMQHKTSAQVKAPAQETSVLSKKEIDAFFQAIRREMEGLDSDFRRRVCLRDLVMMELLFYHGIEVSELLRLKVTDYDQKTGVLTVRKKRGGDQKIYLYSKVLREQMERWLTEHGCFEREAEYREMLFLSKLGRPLSMKMVINIVEKYRELAGIEKAVTPKDLKGSMGAYARELMREVCG